MAKVFLASWGLNFVSPGIKQVDESFFCDENCYDEDEIQRINELEVGEIFTSNHYSDHVAIRLADDSSFVYTLPLENKSKAGGLS